MGTISHLNLPQSRVTPTDPSSIKYHHLTSHCHPSVDVRLQDSEKESWQKKWHSYTVAHTPHTRTHHREKRNCNLGTMEKTRCYDLLTPEIRAYIKLSKGLKSAPELVKVVTPSFFLSWKLLSSLFIRKSFCPFPFSLCKNPYPPPLPNAVRTDKFWTLS